MEVRKISEIPYMEFPTGRKTYVMIGENGAVKGEKFCQGYVEIQPGGSIPVHEHETVESYTVLEGVGELFLDGEVRTMNAGEYVFIRSCQKHGFTNIGTGKLSLMFVYAPQIIVDHWEKELNGEL